MGANHLEEPTVLALLPDDLAPLLAGLYEAPEEAVAWMAGASVAAWVALNDAEEVLGAIGARPSPKWGAELVGGAFPGPTQHAAALALAQAAQAELGRVYAFAEPHLWPYEALMSAGWREVGAYRRLTGRMPLRHLDPPPGAVLHPLAAVQDLAVRLDALSTFEDRIGHHAVLPEFAVDGAAGFDSHLSLIALDDQGRGIGLCRASIEDGLGRVDSPGVHPDWRSTALRAALLDAVNGRLRAAGITQISLDSWGDTAAELAHDLKLGLHVVDETPIYSAP